MGTDPEFCTMQWALCNKQWAVCSMHWAVGTVQCAVKMGTDPKFFVVVAIGLVPHGVTTATFYYFLYTV